MKKAIKKPAKHNLNGSTKRSDNTPIYNKGDINQYNVGKTMLIEQKKLELKNIKTFNGRQGIGVSANIYFEGKQCGTFLDEANGGEYYHDWNHNCSVAENAWKYLMSLPKFSNIEWKESIKMEVESYDTNKQNNSWKWYWADCLINAHLLQKDMNKWLRKVVIFNTKTKKIEHYKAKASCLNEPQYRKAFNAIGGVILNDLPKQEAYDYFNQYK